MNKLVVGIVVGAVLGVIDGLTAWFTPAARPQIVGILMGSCVKGMVVGVLSGAHTLEILDRTPHTHILRSIADLPALLELP